MDKLVSIPIFNNREIYIYRIFVFKTYYDNNYEIFNFKNIREHMIYVRNIKKKYGGYEMNKVKELYRKEIKIFNTIPNANDNSSDNQIIKKLNSLYKIYSLCGKTIQLLNDNAPQLLVIQYKKIKELLLEIDNITINDNIIKCINKTKKILLDSKNKIDLFLLNNIDHLLKLEGEIIYKIFIKYENDISHKIIDIVNKINNNLWIDYIVIDLINSLIIKYCLNIDQIKYKDPNELYKEIQTLPTNITSIIKSDNKIHLFIT